MDTSQKVKTNNYDKESTTEIALTITERAIILQVLETQIALSKMTLGDIKHQMEFPLLSEMTKGVIAEMQRIRRKFHGKEY